MKRLFLTLVILTAGSSAYWALCNSAMQYRREAAINGETWMAQTQTVAEVRSQYIVLTERIRDLKRRVSQTRQTPATSALAGLIATNSWRNLSPEMRERLLAELGFNWNSTGDYLMVSKDTLRGIGLSGMKGVKMTDVACQVLAITPEERAAIEATTQRLGDDYKVWAQSHVQREEQSGDVVAKYTMPVDEEFSQSLSNRFVGGITTALGEERGGLLRQYSSDWMTDLGMYGAGLPNTPTTMTVKRYKSGDESRLAFELKQAGNTMYTDVSPGQPFPEAFRAIFPGGWTELAEREGFELPKAFEKK